MDFEKDLEHIRKKYNGDAGDLAQSLPYGLCKKEGISTEGMTPYEAWKKKTGGSPSDAFKGAAAKAEKKPKSLPKKKEKKPETSKTSVTTKSTASTKEEESHTGYKKHIPEKSSWGKDPHESVVYRHYMTMLKSEAFSMYGDTFYMYDDSGKEWFFDGEDVCDPKTGEIVNDHDLLTEAMNNRLIYPDGKKQKSAEESAPKEPAKGEWHDDMPAPKMIETGTLKNWKNKINDFWKVHGHGNFFGYKGEDLKKIQKNMTKMFDNADLLINMNSADLGSVLETHYGNQFETHKSDGAFDFSTRTKVHKYLFGSDEKGVNYEKYGYMMDKDNYERVFGSSSPHYGAYGSGNKMALVLRKDLVKDRTTYVVHDSFRTLGEPTGHSAAGAVDTQCSIEGLGGYAGEKMAKYLRMTENPTIAKMLSFGSKWEDYVECQYHGEVSAKEIGACRFANASDCNNAWKGLTDKQKEICKKNGIAFEWYNSFLGQYVKEDF